ncbi:MAG: DUF3887 domain-containing protein [Capsulimonadaceae bacterium]|nr:DUF3887 domain-containing protein [Capsulimonadaceae bacterium]
MDSANTPDARLSIASEYVINLFAQNYEAAYSLCTSTIRQSVTPERAAAGRALYIKNWGDFKGITGSEEQHFSKPNGVFDGYSLQCEFEDGIKTIDIVFDHEPRQNEIYSIEIPDDQEFQID